MSGLIMVLRDGPEPQTGNTARHDLLDTLMIALVASICGFESFAEFADFAEDREDVLREFLGLEHGFQRHETFWRLFRLIDPDALAHEDHARNRKDHGPANLAVLRKLALNVLRTARPKLCVKRKRRRSDGPTPSHDPSSAKCRSPALPSGRVARNFRSD